VQKAFCKVKSSFLLSVDFKPYKSGLMCVFTLKNPSYPEHLVFAESEVLSVDIHHLNSSLVALGLLDGNIEVYDLTKSCAKPQYCSSSVNNKHAAAVWQVQRFRHYKNLRFAFNTFNEKNSGKKKHI
jgi:hypothetical protein